MEKELITILIAASPISELRGAIPAAIFLWKFSALKAFSLSILGNFLPVIPLLFFWRYFSGWLMRRFYFFNRFFTWLFERTRKKHSRHFELWEEIALWIFVAIPLPLTGAWTGTVAAFIFGIPFWKSVLMIALGIITASLIVLLLLIGGEVVL